MITPGLLRRSLARALQWRLIALELLLLGLCTWIAAHPWIAFFQKQLGHLPRGRELMAQLGSHGAADLLGQVFGPVAFHPEVSLASSAVVALLCGPLFAAAVLAVSASDEALHSRELLEGAGRYYGRMFRALCAALIPIGVCGGLAALAFKWSSGVEERAITEGAAMHASRLASVAAVFAFVVASIWIDAGRAVFVAQPARRSAFFATFAGGLLMLRRPLRALAIGGSTMVLSLGLAGFLVVERQHVVQRRGGEVLFAFLLSQLAVAVLAWGRAARLLGFVELARADTLARAQPAGTFEMSPPSTVPPPPFAPASPNEGR